MKTPPLKSNAIPQGADARDKVIVISKRAINLLVKPEKDAGRQILWDGQLKGFGLRHYPTGKITFVLQLRMKFAGAKTQTITIGQYGSPWSPDTARARARELLELVSKGVDPVAQEREAQAAKLAAETNALKEQERDHYYDFDEFADRFMERHVKAGELRSQKDIEGTFDRDLRPFFRGRSILGISKQDCKEMRSFVGLRSQSAANKAHKWLNAALQWGTDHDGLETSPMLDLRRPFPEPRRQRALAEWELALIWSILPALSDHFAMHMRLLILTGQRLREVSGIRWEELDLVRGVWIIPASRTKNKLEHLVPISDQMHRLLDDIEPDKGKRRGLLFTTNGRTPISGFSKSKKHLDALITAASADATWARRGQMKAWVRHDIRRTFSTMCGEMNIQLQHAEAVLNHVSGSMGGIVRTYMLYRFEREKRAALNKWGKRLEKLLVQNGVKFLPDAE